MALIERISQKQQLQRLAAKLGVRPNWHEPDEQEVTARVFGVSFDNAGFWGEGHGANGRISAADAEEMWVRLYQDGTPVADVNLATLFAIACGEGE